MRAVRNAPPEVEVVDVDEPEGDGALIQVVAAGICASDLQYLQYGSREIAGHEVYQAGDGPGGLEEASRSRPDVAIVDIGLPGMNGFEVARRLKSGAPTLRLIALTGYGQGDHRRLGDEAGFEAYLVKPVAFETLQRALANN